MAKGLDIRRRIRSVKNTKAITKAMEMVAASKMRKAQEAALRTRAYAEKALDILSTVGNATGADADHPFFQKSLLVRTSLLSPFSEGGRSQRFLLFFITPNKGLCGSLNANLVRSVMAFIGEQQPANSNRRTAGETPFEKGGRGDLAGEQPTVISEQRQAQANKTGSDPQYHIPDTVYPSFDFITLGKKGRDALMRLGYHVKADYSHLGDMVGAAQLMPIAREMMQDFSDGNYDAVYVVYTHFYSVIAQKPVIRRILPLGRDILEGRSHLRLGFGGQAAISDPAFAKASTFAEASADKSAGRQQSEENIKAGRGDFQTTEYLFEPSPAEVLTELLPRLTEMQIFQAALEAQASEQSARMVAMQNATKAAGELVDDLTLTYNKARQASITQEISEIVGGVEALKQ